ncbi:MAG: alanine--tRNA ligase [Bacilli bacterium]|nr:alanine--tRNA ligase [Bacilli bacterium]
MKKLTSLEIRKMWLSFFESKGHKIMESAPLIPIDDDSLLWINAGVTPLKKYFDGSVVPENRRITNIQKCIRTNDIENVGVTRRHHTFFEMMGNFSVGDYFRDSALEFAYELLTSEKWFNIPIEKLYFTVYPDDTDTINKWISLGVPESHLARLSDNFWEIGEGPCGPDTEIFFDRGEKYDYDGKALEHFMKGEDNERFVEIWNNVLSQFNSKEGVKREDYKELPSKNIDTGAGLERWACIFQDADSNFDTDLFLPIIRQIEELTDTLYDGSMPYKVIADHIRALTFALSDGAVFDNVGRGYILRRLLRRSVRYGRMLGLYEPFMYKLVDSVVKNMESVYPYLKDKQKNVKNTIKEEEELFLKTLDKGEKILYQMMDESLDNKISGRDAFKLYDTYGFPFELTLEYLEEKGFTTSRREFDKCMERQKELSKNNQKQTESFKNQNELLLNYKDKSEFIYEVYEVTGKVISIIKNDKFVSELKGEGYIVFDKTCFYSESGGEISDTGMLIGDNFKARVLDVFKGPNGQNIHKVKILSGVIKVKDKVKELVDKERRLAIEANHSSVHILQLALQTIIDKNIYQAGSKVTDEYLRFDFNYHGKITDTELIKIEEFVNDYISKNIDRKTEVKKYDDVDKKKVMALFTDKYNEKVRVVNIGDSHELCGGCHVKNTKDIKRFTIISFENKGSNTYRITGATRNNIENSLLIVAKPYNDNIIKNSMKASNLILEAKRNNIKLKYKPNYNNEIKPMSYKEIVELKELDKKVQNDVKELEKDYQKLISENAVNNISEYEKDIEKINNLNVLLLKVNDNDNNSLKNILDTLANKYENIFILVANINVSSNKVTFIARSNSNINASDMIKLISNKTGGNGGGSPKFAMGSGIKTDEIDKIFLSIKKDL